MKLSRKVATRALALVATGGVVVGITATALAAPPYEPDPSNQLGQILLYDASGNPVTSGNINDDPIAKFAVATSDDPQTANTQATLYAYTPVNGQPPGNWSGEQLSHTTAFPVASPANIAAAGAHRPVVTLTTQAAGDTNLAGYISDFPNGNTAGSGYENLYQLRILTANNTKWWATDIQVNPATGAWTLAYPTIAATTTTLTATPASPQTAPASAVTLKATVTDNATGTVVFKDTDSNTQVGSPQTLPGSGGGANFGTVTVPAGLSVGTHHYSATFTAAAGAPFGNSNGSLTYQVNAAPADTTATSLSVSPLPSSVGDQFTLSSDVSDVTVPASTPQGTVAWWDNGVAIPGASAHTDAAGHAEQGPSDFSLGTGNHAITAHFTPDTPTQFDPSVSQAVNFTLSPAAGDPCNNTDGIDDNASDPRANTCIDDQTFQVTVPTGTLVISTPWTPGHPFDLGTMALSSDGTYLHTSANFGTGAAGSPVADGVTITDTRAGDDQWSAAVTATNFTHGPDVINSCNLGFTGVAPHYISGNALNAATKPVTVNDVANGGVAGIAGPTDTCASGLKAGPHQFAHAAHGDGSVYVGGVMDLYAPTSTRSGLYAATVEFTVF